jgi:hypothetical protein
MTVATPVSPETNDERAALTAAQTIEALVCRTVAEQGLPERITDRGTLNRVAALMASTSTPRPRRATPRPWS